MTTKYRTSLPDVFCIIVTLKNLSKFTQKYLRKGLFWLGVVENTCNPDSLEAEFQNGLGLILVGGNSPSLGGVIVWPSVIQHKEKGLTKYWDQAEI